MLKSTFTLGLMLLTSGLVPVVALAGEVAAPTAGTSATTTTTTTTTAVVAGEPLVDRLQPGLAADAVRRYAKAVTIRRQGDIEEAKQQLMRLTIDYPSYYNALVLLANNLDFERERKIAIDTMERAVKVQQEEKIADAEAAYRLGMMYMDTNQEAKALETFQLGLGLEATNSREMNGMLYNAVGACYALLGDDEKSLANHKIALEKYGNLISARRVELIEARQQITTEINRADRAVKPGVKSGYDITTTLPLPAVEPGDAKDKLSEKITVPGPVESNRKPKADPRSAGEKYEPFVEPPVPVEP